ncbi:MAG: hypothetical protein AB7K36_28815, partial [Chloroflexota bacterium]
MKTCTPSRTNTASDCPPTDAHGEGRDFRGSTPTWPCRTILPRFPVLGAVTMLNYYDLPFTDEERLVQQSTREWVEA